MDVNERENIGKRGREYYDANFGREELIARLEHWFREVAAKKRA